MNVRRIFAFVIVAALLPASRAYSRTWSILSDHTGDAPTIQAGIDSAATGDTVLVQAGTYVEDITFDGKLITVLAASGPGNTILVGTSPVEHVVTFGSGEGRESRLEGFTIQGGLRGIAIVNAEPTIVGNIITENGCMSCNSFDGAGILCFGSLTKVWSPLITENDIRQNVATANGGGIAIEYAMTPEVLNNTIFDNEAKQSGGGIYVITPEAGTVLQHNTIDSNIAALQGGGIYVQGTGGTPLPIDIGFSVIIKNNARGMGSSIGGGLYLNNTSLLGHHLTAVQNTVPAGQIGGGIAFDGGTPRLEKSIIAFNTAGAGIGCTGGATPLIRYNLAWQNAGMNGSGDCSTWDQANGNLVADPLFCNLAAGDVTVAADSPAMFPPNGPMGAYITPGCPGTPVLHVTWGSLKVRFDR
jgi:parallel beta-helix repeat protein